MKRRASLFALSFISSVMALAATPGGGQSLAAEPNAAQRSGSAGIDMPPPDASLVAEVSRLVEASLEALRDGRDDRHERFLHESLEKLPNFPPARWQSGYVWFEGAWVHVDQIPYLTADSPTLRKYAELREKADEKYYPRATTAEARREYPLERQLSDQIYDQKNSSYRTTVRQSDRGGTIYIPSTAYYHEQSSMWGQLDTYANERVRLTNTAGYSSGYARAQESLARWCGKNGLDEEARVHWAKLLSQEPTNREAARALGLVEFRGQLVTPQQLERAKQLNQDVAQSLDKWQAALSKLSRDAASPDESRRNAALTELSKISESDSVFALEAVALWQRPANGQKQEFVEAFQRKVVEVIAKFDTQAAVESLVRFAVLHAVESVRHAAADALRPREPERFVPLLLAGLTMPIEYDVKVVEDLKGQKQFQAGARQELDDHIAGLTDTREVYNGWHLRMLTSAALARASQIEQFNRLADQLNRRIVAALVRAVKFEADSPYKDLASTTEYDKPDPKRWGEWWNDYNERYSSGQKPYYGYDYNWYTTATFEGGYKHSAGTRVVQDWYVRCVSCFVKGTPVWTLAGPRPIEELKVGDRVLSQNPETGELAYKAVLGTTLRPPSEMLTIRTGETSLKTTMGHPFFVVGKGWRMAKQLKDDDWICAQGRTLSIDSIDKAQTVEAYNLMVMDFGTYFVGKDRVLVHDNSPIPPARLEMPGLVAAR